MERGGGRMAGSVAARVGRLGLYYDVQGELYAGHPWQGGEEGGCHL